MPFRLWYYLSRVGGFVLFAVVAATFAAPSDSVPGRVRFVATCALILLGLVGAFLGVLLACHGLRMLCPFCGRSGYAGGSKRDGMWMVCESCGLIHGSGPLGLKIVRENPEDAA